MRGRGGRASCRAHRSFLSHEGVARAIPRPSVAGNTMPPARSSELLDQRTSIVNGSAGRSWTALGSCMWPYYRQGRPPPTCGGRPWAVERCSAKHILPQGRMSVAWIDEAAATGELFYSLRQSVARQVKRDHTHTPSPGTPSRRVTRGGAHDGRARPGFLAVALGSGMILFS